MHQVHLMIIGDVTGVGYRAWAKRLAERLEINGWVRNVADGQVETVAQGTRDRLNSFISQCRRGPETGWVEDITVTWQQMAEPISGFQIAF